MKHRVRVIWGLTVAAAVVIACDSGGGGSEPGGASAEDTRRMLAHLADDVWVPAVDDFAEKAKNLDDAAAGYAANPEDAALHEAAQEAWREAMSSWQVLEPLQIGPALPPARAGGQDVGQDLRAQIYSWPTTGLCRVDQVLVTRDYDKGDFAQTEGINARGLDVMEYLLFASGDDSACPPTVDIIEDGSWERAAGDGLTPRRAAYAAVLAKDVLSRARELSKAWQSFRDHLAQAGDGSEVFDMTQDALNAVTDGLFYLDTETKTMKLGEPTGHAVGCDAERCPEDVEHPFAEVSKQSVLANLQGAERMFRGTCDEGVQEPCGLFDLLRTVGAGDLATRMSDALDGAQDAAEAIEPSLKEAIQDNAPEPGEAYDALRELTTLMKTEFLATLDLSPPASAAADND